MLQNRIFIVPPVYDPGTAATNRALALVHAIDAIVQKYNADVHVVLFERNQKRDVYDYRYKNINVIDFTGYNSRVIHPFKRIFYALLKEVRFYLALKQNDTVLLLGYPQLLSWMLAKKGVHVYHEMNEHPSLFSLGPKWQRVSLKKYLKLCRRLDGLFVISQHLKDYFAQNGVISEKIHIYRMIVDPSRFEGLKKNKKDEQYIAYCGTATNYKDGVDTLLRSFSIIKKKFPGHIKLHIYGRVPSEKEKKDNDLLIDRLGIKNEVVYAGQISPEDMPQKLKDSEVLVLARPDNIQSKYGFPTKLGEYLLTKNPVVVTKVGDIPYYLKDYENALLAEPDNAESVAEKIQWALNNKEEAYKIGRRGSQVALECFNANTEAKNILNVITNRKE